MRILVTQLKWQLQILAKNNLVLVSIIVTIIYGVIFYFIRDLPGSEKFLVLLIFNDPAIIGLFFVGLSIIIEKNEEVLPALMVTPLTLHVFLISRVLSLSFIGWACASGMAIALLGFEVDWVQFSAGVFSTCVIFSLAGIFIVSYTMEFLNFMLRSIPLLFLLSLPLLNYFDLTNLRMFDFMPLAGPIDLIAHSMSFGSHNGMIWQPYIIMSVWTALAYLAVYRVFQRRVLKGF